MGASSICININAAAAVQVLLVTAAFMLAAVHGMPEKMTMMNFRGGGLQSWNSSSSGFNFTNYWGFWHPNGSSCNSKRIVVGGSDNNWHFGFNYTDWAINNAPFYLNDTLVFKYDPPNGTNHAHSVYMFRNYRSYQNCDLKRAKRVADPSQGGGRGFEFVIKEWRPHYFACGESNGIHCKLGLMKFVVMPFFRWNF